MIPAAFDYKAPTSVDEALQLLAEGGDDAKIIAGGQSLLPVMKLRLAAPELLIDLAKIDSLKGVRDDGDAIVIGAMTPHFEVVRRSTRRRACIADRQMRRDCGRPASPASRNHWRGLRARGSSGRPSRTDGGPGRRVRDRRSWWATTSRSSRLFPRSLHDCTWR